MHTSTKNHQNATERVFVFQGDRNVNFREFSIISPNTITFSLNLKQPGLSQHDLFDLGSDNERVIRSGMAYSFILNLPYAYKPPRRSITQSAAAMRKLSINIIHYNDMYFIINEFVPPQSDNKIDDWDLAQT